MATKDWNGDGKTDSYDDYAEYEGLYHSDVGGGLNQYHGNYSGRRGGGGISGFGMIFSIIAGLVGQALLYTALGIDVADVPVIVMLLLWAIISGVTMAILMIF